mgnify:CR=1 FL=1
MTDEKKPPRGKCSRCPYRWRLTKDGKVQAHMLFGAWVGKRYCEGGGKPPAEESR